jgi:hypothetical protein
MNDETTPGSQPQVFDPAVGLAVNEIPPNSNAQLTVCRRRYKIKYVLTGCRPEKKLDT